MYRSSSGETSDTLAAVEERAKAEIKKAIKENIPHIPEKTIKTQIRQSTVKSKPTLKKKTPQKELKRKRDTGDSIFNRDEKKVKRQ